MSLDVAEERPDLTTDQVKMEVTHLWGLYVKNQEPNKPSPTSRSRSASPTSPTRTSKSGYTQGRNRAWYRKRRWIRTGLRTWRRNRQR